ncbi:HAMP domain-containing sensor histidine kinase [Kitasatospora sp. NPDC002227]|uniref:sensor histidine kinase n=1 Tax=Kitasatospora sp. NPDC002227 TaxID=3154773 RepID=UPI0033333238
MKPRWRRQAARTPAEARTRRMRRRLTALYTLTSAVGLVCLAALAVHHDGVSRSRQTDGELKLQVTQAVSGLAFDENGVLDAHSVGEYVETGCPALYVLTSEGEKLTPAYTPPKPCVHPGPGDLQRVSAAAVEQEDWGLTDGRGSDGRPLRLAAEVFGGGEGEGVSGTVVAVADLSTDRAAHRDFAELLAAGCAGLLALSAAAGHLLSRRAVRPALTALQQQEAFLADAAHDLRTPAASLRLLAETARHGDGPTRDAALERTERLAARMGDLVDGLLTRARLTAGVVVLARQPLRLDQLAEAVADETPADGHRVTVHTEPAVVEADPELLRRAVANLLGNALAHGHAPGEPAEVRLTVAADGTLTVDDAGPGIPPELAGSLFERFRSGSGSTGLGLSIASWIARAHGGSLEAGESPLGGARFTLRLAVAK